MTFKTSAVRIFALLLLIRIALKLKSSLPAVPKGVTLFIDKGFMQVIIIELYRAQLMFQCLQIPSLYSRLALGLFHRSYIGPNLGCTCSQETK